MKAEWQFIILRILRQLTFQKIFFMNFEDISSIWNPIPFCLKIKQNFIALIHSFFINYSIFLLLDNVL